MLAGASEAAHLVTDKPTWLDVPVTITAPRGQLDTLEKERCYRVHR